MKTDSMDEGNSDENGWGEGGSIPRGRGLPVPVGGGDERDTANYYTLVPYFVLSWVTLFTSPVLSRSILMRLAQILARCSAFFYAIRTTY